MLPRALTVFFIAASLTAACGGKSKSDPASSGGSAGSGGSAASGGAAGAGGGVIGGAAGLGGGGATAGQCSDSSQCKLFSDCCSCMALGPGDPEPSSCLADCLQDACSAMGVTSGKAACVLGSCVVGFDCDGSKVLCNALPPLCEPGSTPSVVGGCWGQCVPVTECMSVASCLDCQGPLTTCVTIDLQGAESAPHHCVTLPKGCEGDPTCSCIGSSVCPSPYTACSDLSGVPGVVCSCPNC